jgi:IS5 family transposase
MRCATRSRLRCLSWAAGSRAHGIAPKLRLCAAAGREEAQATVRRITGKLAELAGDPPSTPRGC